jgi:peptidoglycan-N-acetylglucosamine deacetylase
MLTFRRVNTALLLIFLSLNLTNLFFDTGYFPYIALFSVYFFLVARGSSRICSAYHFPVKCAGSKEHKALSLTFDDGPDPVMTPRLLEVLDRHNVKGAFFCTGTNVLKHPELIREMAENGHLIGNHTFHHGFMFDLKPAFLMVREIRKTNDAIHASCGQFPVFFRPPYGVTNPAMKRALKKTKLIPVGWSIKTSDTSGPSPEKLMKKLRNAGNGDIILLHDRVRNLPEVLDAFIRERKENGWIFERTDVLLFPEKKC